MKRGRNQKRKTCDVNKPPYSMLKLVGQALISNSPRNRLRGREITKWISETYPYYRSSSSLYTDVLRTLSKFRYYILDGRRTHEWCIAPEFEDVIRKTSFIPQIINSKTGYLKKVNIEQQAKELDKENNTVYLPHDSVYLPQDDMLRYDELRISEKSPPTSRMMTRRRFQSEANTVVSEKLPTPEILPRRSWEDAIVKPDPSSNKSTVFTTKEERDVIDVEENPLPQNLEEFEMPREMEFWQTRPMDSTVGEYPRSMDSTVGEYTRSMDSTVGEYTGSMDSSAREYKRSADLAVREYMKTDSAMIDLTDGTDVICPICSQRFINNERLGEHVRSHQSPTSSSDNTRMKETFQNLASTVFGSDKNIPICVFTGNVYLSREGP